MEVTLNEQQKLFVLKSDQYTSCLGFDVVYGYCQELVIRLTKLDGRKSSFVPPTILESERGTIKQYSQYQSLLKLLGDRKTGTWFNHRTPSKVRKTLERCRKEGNIIRIFYGDSVTGRCWMSENDVLGRVGRSTGPMQIPLLVAEGEGGGPALLDSCVVRIIDVSTRAELYRHPLYFLPEMEIRAVDSFLLREGYTHGVWVKSPAGQFTNNACFNSFGKAAQWAAFMTGECNEQPD